jgi:hypothetical protein
VNRDSTVRGYSDLLGHRTDTSKAHVYPNTLTQELIHNRARPLIRDGQLISYVSAAIAHVTRDG